MTSQQKFTAHIYHLKLLVVGISLALVGVFLSILADWLGDRDLVPPLVVTLLSGLSDVLLVTGAIGIAVDFFTGRDKESADTERTRAVMKELTPDFTDAVLQGLAVKPDDLKRVASPELLDDISTNALALRLDDPSFAREIYTDVRDQAIRAEERWHDARVSVDLGISRGSTEGATPSFDVIVRWEYTVRPRHRIRKFAVVSDRQRYNELAAESGETSVWLKSPAPGMEVTDRSTFELMQFTVDGRELKVRRDATKASQVYRVDLGARAGEESDPVAVSFIYRVRVPQSGHLVYFDVDRPTRGIDMHVNYQDVGIARLRVVDHLSSSTKARVTRSPADSGTRSVTVGYDGWVLPRAGVAFVWTLDSEMDSTEQSDTHHARAA